jgi:uncharacterized protein with von Willebrand factor type A (vWA) domain
MQRVLDQFSKVVWLNPVRKSRWPLPTIQLARQMTHDRMYYLSVDGIEQAMKYLAR